MRALTDGPPPRTRERLLVLGCALAAGIPVVVAVVHALAAGWTPLGDNAFIAVRGLDVFTLHPPLLGQWSSGATAVVGQNAYSPGPLLFWLVAVPERVLGAAGIPLVVGVMNLACVAGVVALAHRRGGRALTVAAAVGLALTLASLPGDLPSDVWNSSAPLLPLLLLVLLAWSLACGDVGLLPVTVLVASFVAQSHLTFVAAALGVTAVGLAGLLLALRAGGAPAWRRARRPAAVAALVAVVCWSAPALDQAVHRPGNLVLLARSATTHVDTLGSSAGWRAVVHGVGVVPWFLRSPGSDQRRLHELTTTPPVGTTVTAVLVLVGLAGLLALGLRRRRPDLAAAGALGLVLCAALWSVASSTPESTARTVQYTLRWASPGGMVVWLLLGWGAAVLAGPALARRRTARRRPSRDRPRVGAGIAVAAAVVAGIVVAATADRPERPYAQVADLGAGVRAAVPPGGTVRVDARQDLSSLFLLADAQGAVVWALRRDGRHLALDPVVARGFGPPYAPGPVDHVVRLVVDPAAGAAREPVARVRLDDPYDRGRQRVLAATLTSGASSAARAP